MTCLRNGYNGRTAQTKLVAITKAKNGAETTVSEEGMVVVP